MVSIALVGVKRDPIFVVWKVAVQVHWDKHELRISIHHRIDDKLYRSVQDPFGDEARNPGASARTLCPAGRGLSRGGFG